jgi:uncharacterized membrane protein YccC
LGKKLRKIGKFIGGLLFYGTGLLLFVFWLTTMSKWLGTLGIILAIIIAPGVVIFPVVYWIVEGVFPISYFAIWGIGIVGLIIMGISSKDKCE